MARSVLGANDPAVATSARYEIGRGLFAAARGAPAPEAFRRAADELRAPPDRPPVAKASPEAAAKAADRRATARRRCGHTIISP